MTGPSSARRAAGAIISQSSFVGAISRFWKRSYASDYFGLVLIAIGDLAMLFFVEPFHRMFSLDNISLTYPHAEYERVPVTWLFVYAAGIPVLFLLVWITISRSDGHKIHVTLLGLFISLCLTSFLTDIVKNAVGRPRPDLIARCKPEKGTPEHQLVTYQICTETDHHILHDGWRSFPSGHSSFAFAGLGYLAFFLAGQLHVFRPRTDLAHFLFALTPIIGAVLIAISRCEDYRHDVYDVSVGSVLGLSIALFSYRRYYPSLRYKNCQIPYPSRAEGDGTRHKARDEEERIRSAGEFELADTEEEDNEQVPLTART